MEEQILNIITCNGKLINEHGSVNMWYPEETAKEIADHFERFILFCMNNIEFDSREATYRLLNRDDDDQLIFYTTQELYTYWQTNINNPVKL